MKFTITVKIPDENRLQALICFDSNREVFEDGFPILCASVSYSVGLHNSNWSSSTTRDSRSVTEAKLLNFKKVFLT